MARPDSTGDDRAIALIECLGEPDADKQFALHNLAADSGESMNLATVETDRFAVMKTAWHELKRSIGDLCDAGRTFVEKRLKKNKSAK